MLFYNVRQCLKISNFAGVNPLKNDKIQWLVYRIIILGALSVLYLEVLLLVYKEEKLTIIDFTEAYSGMSMVIHGIQRSSGLYLNRSTLAILIQQMETHFWSPEDIRLSKDEKQFFADTHQRLKTAFKMLILFCSMNSGCACFQTFFLPENVLAFVCYEPEGINFWYIWTLQVFVMVFSIVIPIISLDVFLMTILVLTELQFRLLNKEVEAVFDIDANTATDENVEKRVIRVISQHNFLLEYTKLINQTFSGSMLAYMAIIVSSMCVEMYNLSSGAEIGLFLRAVFYVNVALIGLVVYYCLPAQNLTDEMHRIQNSAYFSRWYNYPKQSQSMMLMISAAQRDVNITAGRLVNINLETSLSTIKTMVSYCMFLQTMGSK